jgi:hypothetical protein
MSGAATSLAGTGRWPLGVLFGQLLTSSDTGPDPPDASVPTTTPAGTLVLPSGLALGTPKGAS